MYHAELYLFLLNIITSFIIFTIFFIYFGSAGLSPLNPENITITVFDFDQGNDKIIEKQTISTLPDDFSGENMAADIHVHPSGKFLYASNRGHNSIAVFKIDNNGRLSTVEHESAGINFPRDFIVSFDGKFMIIGNEKGNSFNSYFINESTGRVSFEKCFNPILKCLKLMFPVKFRTSPVIFPGLRPALVRSSKL